MNERWMSQAACRGMDPDLFFPELGDATAVKAAKDVCEDCPVQLRCLAWALEQACFYEAGILGATTAQQRRKMRKGWFNLRDKGAA